MQRTPDEIKKGIKCCHINDVDLCDCESCPYAHKGWQTAGCDITMAEDALALIQQLQDDNAEKDQRIRQLEAERDVLDYTLAGVMHSVDKWLDVEPYKMDGPTGNDAVTRSVLAREIALKAIEQAQAERDAAVRDMTEIVQNSGDSYCEYCKNWKPGTCPPHCRTHSEGFRWRGVQKEK